MHSGSAGAGFEAVAAEIVGYRAIKEGGGGWVCAGVVGFVEKNGAEIAQACDEEKCNCGAVCVFAVRL